MFWAFTDKFAIAVIKAKQSTCFSQNWYSDKPTHKSKTLILILYPSLSSQPETWAKLTLSHINPGKMYILSDSSPNLWENIAKRQKKIQNHVQHKKTNALIKSMQNIQCLQPYIQERELYIISLVYVGKIFSIPKQSINLKQQNHHRKIKAEHHFCFMVHWFF